MTQDSDVEAGEGPLGPRPVVGIGASAGGLESLEQFFDNMPADTGMAFVVIQHLSPNFKSLMDELLARHSTMPVELAQDGTEVEPNHVYLMPPKKEMIIRDRRLVLTDKEPKPAFTRPIDQFLRSLAQDCGSEAAAVILSGSGSDGAKGVQEIKQAGGVTIVETPESAKFDGMPVSALATGMVDHVCTPNDIPRLLASHRWTVRQAAPLERSAPEESAVAEILRLLRDAFGLDFNHYKMGTVMRRVQRRLQMGDTPDLDAYVEMLERDHAELERLYRDLLIGVTQFFRDPDAFTYLERHVVPELLERVAAQDEIRAWVAGCATGEEAYSLAIVLCEQLAAAGRPTNLKILATDVHRDSLETASLGLYSEEQLVHVSKTRLERFFTKRPAGGYQVSQDLRQLIVFAPHDVTRDAPFTKMNLVSCRNLLIYFNPQAQRAVLSLFHFGLVPGGILFLGASETTGSLGSEFTPIDERWKVFRKRRDVRLLEQVRLPPTQSRTRPASSPAYVESGRSHAHEKQLFSTYDQLLDRYMPPSFLIDEDRCLIDSFGGAHRLLKVKARRPSQNILDMLEGDLRTVLAGAVQRLFKNSEVVSYRGVRLRYDEGVERRCTLTAEPIRHRRSGTTHILVTMVPEDGPEDAPRALPAPAASRLLDLDTATAQRIETLEEELGYTRETLQSTIEELETSNEELQAANEELVASNEELQSTNEELHSVNEELYTVNAEHQKRIEELRELNADMQHLLDGTDVGTIFLDHELRIRKYTTRIAEVFHILPQDVGRRIRDFSHNVRRPSLLQEIESVLRNGVRVEEEVRDLTGTAYFLRILPYRSADRSRRGTAEDGATGTATAPEHAPPQTNGVVLTLTDISALERARAQLAELSAIVASSDDAIIGKNLEGIITSWNIGAERLYGYTAEEVVGHPIGILVPPERQSEVTRFIEAARQGQTIDQSHTLRLRKDGTAVDVAVKVSPIRNRAGAIVGASSIARDISELRAAQRELQQRENRIRLLLDSTAEAIYGVDRRGVVIFCNPACARMLGYESPGQLIGHPVNDLVRHLAADRSLVPPEETGVLAVLRSQETVHRDDEYLRRTDGSAFPTEYWARPIRQGDEVVGVVVAFIDITDRRQAEDEMRQAAQRREHFLAMLSHELRNPLAAVLNATKVMQIEGAPGDLVDHARQVIARQAHHMARLLEDLLDVSRITRGKFTLRDAPLDLRTVVEAACESLEPMKRKRDIAVTCELADAPLPVRGDVARLQQVVTNLVANALRYSEPGTEVTIRLARAGDQAVLSVSDHGAGIDGKLLPQIFELFVQAEQHLDRPHGGLGVGLTLVRHIVEAHGGRVEAFSEGEGKGSEFRVTLPLDLERRAEESNDDASTNGSGAPRRVVVVEDQDDAREMLRLLLEARGHHVVTAHDGPSGVEVIVREKPDAAFVDLGLPAMSGYEVARELRRDRTLDAVFLVALTGYGAASDVATAREAGFDAHLTKPAELQHLEALLAKSPRPPSADGQREFHPQVARASVEVGPD